MVGCTVGNALNVSFQPGSVRAVYRLGGLRSKQNLAISGVSESLYATSAALAIVSRYHQKVRLSLRALDRVSMP